MTSICILIIRQNTLGIRLVHSAVDKAKIIHTMDKIHLAQELSKRQVGFPT